VTGAWRRLTGQSPRPAVRYPRATASRHPTRGRHRDLTDEVCGGGRTGSPAHRRSDVHGPPARAGECGAAGASQVLERLAGAWPAPATKAPGSWSSGLAARLPNKLIIGDVGGITVDARDHICLPPAARSAPPTAARGRGRQAGRKSVSVSVQTSVRTALGLL
jgi:hypothetical protein